MLRTRLWHWELIPVLPRQQLLGQWRECCLIIKNIYEQGSPNHILVDPIMWYPPQDLDAYVRIVGEELMRRGYTWNYDKYTDYRPGLNLQTFVNTIPDVRGVFKGWHNDQYFWQCFYNLQEKHDRGGINDDEWELIKNTAVLHNHSS